MAAINQIKLNSTSTTYDVNDKRITTSAVSTATHFLATDGSVSSIAPITAANAASVLGVGGTSSKMHFFDVKSSKDGTTFDDNEIRSLLADYFDGRVYLNQSGVSFICVTCSDGATFTYLMQGNGPGYSSAIELCWYRPPRHIKFTLGTFVFTFLA